MGANPGSMIKNSLKQLETIHIPPAPVKKVSMSTGIASKQSKANPIKVTRAQIAELNEKREIIAPGR